MSEDDQAEGGWKPPYVGYTTVANFIDNKCGTNPIPPQIDKTFIDNVAGGVQPLLMYALKVVGFIEEDGSVTNLLRRAAESPDARKAILKAWAADFYAEQGNLAAQNATAQMLYQSFAKSGYTGSTARKAIVFYLNLVEDVGLPKSPHFKPPKQTQRSGAKGKTGANGGTGASTGAGADVDLTPPPIQQPKGEQTVVDLGELGTVTVTVDVQWLKLPDDTFTALRKAIRDLENLAVEDDDEDDEEVET